MRTLEPGMLEDELSNNTKTDDKLKQLLDYALDEFEKQIRLDISNHISGDKSRNPAFSHIDARTHLEVIIKSHTNSEVLQVLDRLNKSGRGIFGIKGEALVIDLANFEAERANYE